MLRLVQAEIPLGERKRYTQAQLEKTSQQFEEALKVWGMNNRNDVKQLFLVHQMIARRLGFFNLNKLFTGSYASSSKNTKKESIFY